MRTKLKTASKWHMKYFEKLYQKNKIKEIEIELNKIKNQQIDNQNMMLSPIFKIKKNND